jgi:hypothetical protein
VVNDKKSNWQVVNEKEASTSVKDQGKYYKEKRTKRMGCHSE